MVLKQWSVKDLITKVRANDFGIRRGTTSEIETIPSDELNEGNLFYDESKKCFSVKGISKFHELREILYQEHFNGMVINGRTQLDDIYIPAKFQNGSVVVIICYQGNNSVNLRVNGVYTPLTEILMGSNFTYKYYLLTDNLDSKIKLEIDSTTAELYNVIVRTS